MRSLTRRRKKKVSLKVLQELEEGREVGKQRPQKHRETKAVQATREKVQTPPILGRVRMKKSRRRERSQLQEEEGDLRRPPNPTRRRPQDGEGDHVKLRNLPVKMRGRVMKKKTPLKRLLERE
jgi:hypothetical protein